MLVRYVQQWACVRVWSSLLLCHLLVPTCVYYQSLGVRMSVMTVQRDYVCCMSGCEPHRPVPGMCV